VQYVSTVIYYSTPELTASISLVLGCWVGLPMTIIFHLLKVPPVEDISDGIDHMWKDDLV
jgi:hypothetical protein